MKEIYDKFKHFSKYAASFRSGFFFQKFPVPEIIKLLKKLLKQISVVLQFSLLLNNLTKLKRKKKETYHPSVTRYLIWTSIS